MLMDVNGTRCHLLKGKNDWNRCLEVAEAGAPPVSAGKNVAWDEQSESLTLKPLLSLFPRGLRDAPLQPPTRRGAAADRFGNWFWIAHDNRKIYLTPAYTRQPLVYWEQVRLPDTGPAGEFGPSVPPIPEVAILAGLAVTENHYLVVGDLTRRGLLIFDLQSDGEPTLLLFPAGVPFEPFDLAPAPGGGVWVLDRTNHTYWGLDRNFRVVTVPALLHEINPGAESAFHPVAGQTIVFPSRKFPAGFPLAVQNPISIEGLPDGSVLILDSPALGSPVSSAPTPSILYHYLLGEQASPALPLDLEVEVATEPEGTLLHHLSLVGYDLAYVAPEQTLYVVDSYGNQTIAFTLNVQSSPPQLAVHRDYLPMYFFGARALVTWGNKVFYDVAAGASGSDTAVQWVQLQVIDEPQYTRIATLLTWTLDGKERDCVWHRLLLDGCLPPETAVVVWTRANNESELLENVSFAQEPNLYLRGRGSEVPFYQPFKKSSAEGLGTWELLFQKAQGRYLQIKLELQGNGRVTPELRALRAYYPRFSYPRRYFPTVYLEDQDSASFLERLLANPEGFYTEIEGKINDVSALFDARSAPVETLDWLAGWLGLIMDPLWARLEDQWQTNGSAAATPPKDGWDRRRLFIRLARYLYNRRGTCEGVQLALLLLLDPCLEKVFVKLKEAAVQPDSSLHAKLGQMGIPSPTPATMDQGLEDIFYQYLLSPQRQDKVRIVERFLTRGGRALVAGDATAAAENQPSAGASDPEAHRFSILVPEDMSAAEITMIKRLVDLEKPAHTQFEIGQYWDYFRVGVARLGLDTLLGKDSRFLAMVVGQNYLAEGFLHPPFPMGSTDRVISDRDQVGRMMPL